MTTTRRDFLDQGCRALSAAAFAGALSEFGVLNVLASQSHGASSDYKALVCIYLDGGNDGNNSVVPIDAAEHQKYAAVRGALTIARDDLLPIVPSSLGTNFGLHPGLAEVHGLWLKRKVAIVSNVGTLVQPTTRETYRSGAAVRPYQLFSHSDQTEQHFTSRADQRIRAGWGGLIADRLAPLNRGVSFPLVTSVAGTTLFGQGDASQPLAIVPSPTKLTQVLVLDGFDGSPAAAARRAAMEALRTIDRKSIFVTAGQDAMDRALEYSRAFTHDPEMSTPFPATEIGHQLRQIAKMIKLNQSEPRLGLSRQIFFCHLGGFDTHQGQIPVQAQLLRQLGAAMSAFYDATIELGVETSVTTFTLSDFGRTFQPSGSGSDHGWGNHLFVMGGAVRGGDFYGVAGPGGTVFPTLVPGGPDDADSRGRWIPTTSVEQYAATLATWFGVQAKDLPSVFPLIGRFSTSDLGFMM